MNFKDKRVTVMGLGTFGGQVAAVRWLADQGAREIIVTDLKDEKELGDSVDAVKELPGVRLKLGRHDEADFREVDAVVVSPAVPPTAPLLAAAADAGIHVTTEMNLFFERCPAPIVGITGSVGKSTVTAMIADVLRPLETDNRTVRVGGNIGHHALLPAVDRIGSDDLVVLELSSFQLERLAWIQRSPHVSVVTNIGPNHADWHGGQEAYASAKQNILRFQSAGDVAILNAQDEQVSGWGTQTKAKVVHYRADDAAGLSLQVVGWHNRSNAAAAMAVATACGVDPEQAAAALADFNALPHRLELVREAGGIRYYNDSKSTSPGATLTALEAFAGEGVVVIVGGYDKHVDLEPLCRELAGRAKAVVAIGQTKSTFCELVKKHAGDGGAKVKMAKDLAGAVRLATHFAAPGDVVLLSPASASYDMFTNYEQRGDAFRALVDKLF